MTFTDKDKMKALAIVHVFETSQPFGDYSACVVLNDGAGVSYGINQFTHRSGSLAAVVREYLSTGGKIGREKLNASLPLLGQKTTDAIERLAADENFKKTLRLAAFTTEMKTAQQHVAAERYLRPAIDICTRFGFVTPLSLAVVYDSVTHGSFELISSRVGGLVRSIYRRTDELAFEKAWITEYVRSRHRWLTDIRRLRVTNYRTKFFLGQIAISNWDLRLPVTVHGVRLTSVGEGKGISRGGAEQGREAEVAGYTAAVAVPGAIATRDQPTPTVALDNAETEGPGKSILKSATYVTTSAVEKFDRVDGVVNALKTRRDAAKSLWTTVAGTASQAAWGVFGFVFGLPRTVWIVVSVIAAALMLFYLYRQIVMGRIRELRHRSPSNLPRTADN